MVSYCICMNSTVYETPCSGRPLPKSDTPRPRPQTDRPFPPFLSSSGMRGAASSPFLFFPLLSFLFLFFVLFSFFFFLSAFLFLSSRPLPLFFLSSAFPLHSCLVPSLFLCSICSSWFLPLLPFPLPFLVLSWRSLFLHLHTRPWLHSDRAPPKAIPFVSAWLRQRILTAAHIYMILYIFINSIWL